MTIADTAVKAGPPHRALYRYLEGGGNALTYGVLTLMADALSTTVEALAARALALGEDESLLGD